MLHLAHDCLNLSFGLGLVVLLTLEVLFNDGLDDGADLGWVESKLGVNINGGAGLPVILLGFKSVGVLKRPGSEIVHLILNYTKVSS